VKPMSCAGVAPLTGDESLIDPGEPLGALSEYYRAFNGRDLDLMRRNWAYSDEISMANPFGGIRRGWADIREGYERIFNGRARISVAFHDYTIHQCGQMFYAVGREQGGLEGGNISLELKFRTSRLFALSDGRWRQFHHHGSIDNPELLLRYQAAIR
jgi:ketosteroid isomerase-like protein